MKDYFHLPVMLDEIVDFLQLKKAGVYIDGTLGGGSYTKKISEKIGPQGKVVSIDLDPMAIDNFSKKKLDNVVLVNDNFSNLKEIALENNIKDVDGIVLDLGLSSAQLDDDKRGFSFLRDALLDMSFGPQVEGDTISIVNNYSLKDLEKIIKDYGQESWAKKIAENIVLYRKKEKIKSVKTLLDIISSSIPRKFWSRRIHPATKTFQALRIETNKELDNLKSFLPVAVDLLKSGGRLVVVSFHSLEDRIVKIFFKDLFRSEKNTFKILTKKPLVPSEAEIEKNPRSRSAKLRVIEKL
jgi:16S rRNA (cytosine1402-N4)-methyltransferase